MDWLVDTRPPTYTTGNGCGLPPVAIHTRQDKAKLLARKKKDGILHETNKFFERRHDHANATTRG
jgi:hypothetical protein